MSVELTRCDRRPSSGPAARLGVLRGQPRQQRGEHPRLRADPRAGRGSRPRRASAQATLAYTKEGAQPRRPADHLDPQLPARARRRLGGDHAADRRARGRSTSSERSRSSSARRGCSRMSTRRCVSPRTSTASSESAGCGAPPRRAPRRSRRSSRASRSTARSPVDASATSSTASTRRGGVAAGSRGRTRHPRGDGSRDRASPRASRSRRASRALARPPVDAAWIGTREPVASASWMICGSTCRPRPGFGSRSANPVTASPGFARATTRQYRPAGSPSSRPDRPARHPVCTRRARPRSRPPTSTRPDVRQARAPRPRRRRRSHHRLTATLRIYLDEHRSRSRTAKRLGIHENTVSYRIRQAEEILGRSVDQRHARAARRARTRAPRPRSSL